ncbi:MAG: hypothetical protein IKR86_11315 [Candidatus Methanomethylophilaceae archaeon]|nr:hypothetical protein [Candidatus Methanomethylophilaceae archaeon]
MADDDKEVRRRHTTVRMTGADAERVDSYIRLGLYPSQSRFAVEAVRDVFLQVRKSAVEKYEWAIIEDGVGEDEIRKALRDEVLVKSGFVSRGDEALPVVVGMTCAESFIDEITEFMGGVLGLGSLQDVFSLCVYLKLRDLDESARIREDYARLRGDIRRRDAARKSRRPPARRRAACSPPSSLTHCGALPRRYISILGATSAKGPGCRGVKTSPV